MSCLGWDQASTNNQREPHHQRWVITAHEQHGWCMLSPTSTHTQDPVLGSKHSARALTNLRTMPQRIIQLSTWAANNPIAAWQQSTARRGQLCADSAFLASWSRVNPSCSPAPRAFLTASIALAVSELLVVLLFREADPQVEVVDAVAKEASLGAGVVNDGTDTSSETKGLGDFDPSPVIPCNGGRPALASFSSDSVAFLGELPACCISQTCASPTACLLGGIQSERSQVTQVHVCHAKTSPNHVCQIATLPAIDTRCMCKVQLWLLLPAYLTKQLHTGR